MRFAKSVVAQRSPFFGVPSLAAALDCFILWRSLSLFVCYPEKRYPQNDASASLENRTATPFSSAVSKNAGDRREN